VIAGETVSRAHPHDRAPPSASRAFYQQPALFPDLTVAENIALRLEAGSSLRRIDWPRPRKRGRMSCSPRIGAAIAPDAEVRSLSMPEQQLVEIACALGAGARIVIMDEPTASLTQKEQHLLFAVVRELRKSGVGVIYISHRLEENLRARRSRDRAARRRERRHAARKSQTRVMKPAGPAPVSSLRSPRSPRPNSSA